MAQDREWFFNTFDCAPMKVSLVNNRFVSVNNGPQIKLKDIKAVESNFAERVFDVPLGNGEIAKLCIMNKQILTYNGRNVETGQKYSPLELPDWVFIFVALYVLNFIFILQGALGGAFAALGAVITSKFAGDKYKSTGKKVILSVLLLLGISSVSLVLKLIAIEAFKL
ncbi:MAG: hypothetical protein IKQ00_04625 [Butyrivibrio sp.]|nr:hypothetical protein [Butyrivibrio sp.]